MSIKENFKVNFTECQNVTFISTYFPSGLVLSASKFTVQRKKLIFKLRAIGNI